LPDTTPEETARWYVDRLAGANVAKALVVSVMPDNQWTRDFLAAAQGHVHALCAVDPRDPGAPSCGREMAAASRRDSAVNALSPQRCGIGSSSRGPIARGRRPLPSSSAVSDAMPTRSTSRPSPVTPDIQFTSPTLGLGGSTPFSVSAIVRKRQRGLERHQQLDGLLC
jgi:hypothetical protein